LRKNGQETGLVKDRMESISLYSEARQEYLKQLSTWLCGPLVEYFRKEYSTINARVGKKAMGEFQTFCSTVPLWNQDVIDTNIGVLLDNCRCDYIEELMTAVFIAHTKMLTSIRVNSRMKKLQITLPKLDHFLHRVFTECARAFWKAPFLFSEENSPIERQKNILQAESMCVEALSAAVRGLLPIKNILRDYLEEDDEEAPTEQIDEVAPAAPVAAPVAAPAAPVEAPVAAPVVVEAPVEALPVVAPIVVEAPVTPKINAVAEAAAEAARIATEPSKKDSKVLIEKLETPPSIETPPPSEHTVTHEEVKTESQMVKIDTEPSVHFTPYDTVFDNNSTEIRYVEKISVEDKEDEVPKLKIGGSSSSLDFGDITELEPVPDIDAPLTTTDDFETLN
jgi:hypothetical protein